MYCMNLSIIDDYKFNVSMYYTVIISPLNLIKVTVKVIVMGKNCFTMAINE